MQWNDTVKQLMGKATHLVRNGRLAEATQAIQHALGQQTTPPQQTARQAQDTAPGAAQAPVRWRPTEVPDVEDAVLVEPGRYAANEENLAPQAGPAKAPASQSLPDAAPSTGTGTDSPRASAMRTAPEGVEAPGSFTRVAFRYPGVGQGLHHYHLYVPPGAAEGTPMPLVVMLHGCTQNPVDFATGTGMNSAATQANALVLYPEQPHSANPNGCWNWFRPGDQRRGRGEPALLVAMVQDVMARHPVDAQCVYAAGLSAGGAMAALLGREYPDLFAAVGVHSGLQAGAAHNVMTALSAMKNGAKLQPRGTPVAAPGQSVVPVIVMHGDADPTVSARNGEQVVATALGTVPGGAAATVQLVDRGTSAHGKGYTRTVYRQAGSGAAGPVLCEHWVLHGAGHAWAGGRAGASHTDPQGVDATQEMLRFFMEHRR